MPSRSTTAAKPWRSPPAPAFIPFTDTRSGGQVEVDQELISLYGALTINISEALQLTGGLRYVDEQKDAVRTGYCEWNVAGSFIPSPIDAGTNCPAILSAEGDIGLSELMPEIAVQWDLGNLMLYGKVQRDLQVRRLRQRQRHPPRRLRVSRRKRPRL